MSPLDLTKQKKDKKTVKKATKSECSFFMSPTPNVPDRSGTLVGDTNFEHLNINPFFDSFWVFLPELLGKPHEFSVFFSR